MRTYEEEVIDIVDQTVREIFIQYFQMEIDLQKLRNHDMVNPFISLGQLLDENAKTVVILSIEKEMMDKLVGKIFASPLEYDTMAHACINEITNIVSSRVKTFLNEHGFDFDMGIPAVIDNQHLPEDEVAVSFVSQDNYLSVDVGMTDYSPDDRAVA